MKSTKRPNDETFESCNAKHADRPDCDESGFTSVIELNEFEMSQIGGGRPTESVSL